MQELDSPHVFFRRVIFDVTASECRVAMEDEHHYFVLQLGHDGERITSVASTAKRTPWTLCPEAERQLQAFVGQPLRKRIAVDLPDIDSKQQCTHQYDLVMVALSQALHPGRREYVAKVRGAMHEYRHAELWLDGEKLLDWRLRGTLVHSQDPCDQQDLRTIMPWADEHLDDQMLEALFVQRRAVMVAASKGFNLDLIPNAGVAMRARAGACFVFQPERAEQAVRVVGSTRKDVQGAGDLLIGYR
ncbi:hypothetical protein BN1049_00892 [Pseudomonas saudimassiliensis]|uniref:DUF2889 domain-containing protein n=1 Tax=Pseudomonas saudimassiliensis TaxID=1461581 RepID=A0A078M9D2_9PSED|nr:DUF2889 domain-containing protein [Pseudomonas saudimassiliensis]CEA02844.1 hypothetical protein BN1049_00892 [Pseudomonas saudimassiliensis]CEF25971.1 hypothetical protein BN1049_00892 [Pseudomonas saudimassiliensis]